LTDFASIISYWSSLFVAVVLIEHLVFRRLRWDNYDVSNYDKWRRLPLGAAAITACILSLGLIIPLMVQVWFVGPLAAKIPGSGELGFEVAFVLCAILYVPLRWLERRWWKH
jgi:purine-cytosine permease-like protein